MPESIADVVARVLALVGSGPDRPWLRITRSDGWVDAMHQEHPPQVGRAAREAGGE